MEYLDAVPRSSFRVKKRTTMYSGSGEPLKTGEWDVMSRRYRKVERACEYIEKMDGRFQRFAVKARKSGHVYLLNEFLVEQLFIERYVDWRVWPVATLGDGEEARESFVVYYTEEELPASGPYRKIQRAVDAMSETNQHLRQKVVVSVPAWRTTS